MSGSLWDSPSFTAWLCARHNARTFRNYDDPLRGQPVPPERQTRQRRRQPPRLQAAEREPRSIHRCIQNDLPSFSLEKLAHHENLWLIYQALKEFRGHAPGADGMTYDQSPSQANKLLRNLSLAILNRCYVPGPTRSFRIEKPTGGFRILQIPNITDRAVGAALSESFRVLLMDRLPRHYGSGASCHAILARMTIYAEDHGWFWLGVDDVQNFFPSIPRALAMDCFMRETDRWNVPRPTLDEQGIPWLVEKVIYGHEGETRTIGLSQGSTISPLLAAIVIKEVLDSEMDNRVENGMIMHRFVDNVHFQGLDRSEVMSAMEGAQSALRQHGMRLKGEGTQTIDVRLATGQSILGVTTRWKNDKLLFDIPEPTWGRFEERLYGATTGLGPDNAQSITWGFIDAFRPTFGVQADNAVNRIHKMMRKGGNYRINKDTIRDWIETARVKWAMELEHIRNPLTSTLSEQLLIEIPELETGPWDGTAPF